MSNHEAPDGDPPASLDDPDWVDRIVAKAMESAEKATGSAGAAAPEVTERPQTEPSDRVAHSRPLSPTEPGSTTPGGSVQSRPEAGGPIPSDAPSRRPPAADAGAFTAGSASPAPAERERSPVVAATAPTSVFDHEAEEMGAPLPIEPDEAETRQASRNRALVEWIAVIAGAIVVAFLVKTFLVQAFYIPSSSMEPTLQINDRVLVNKLSYDFGDVNRGDLVVFERPPNLVSDTEDLIKRVIGLPGETIELIDGRVYISGRGLSEPYVGDLPTNWLGFDETARELCGGDDICTVPEGHVFVMGDNRTGSTDSRRFGPIAEDAIVGRAFLRIWPLNDIGWL